MAQVKSRRANWQSKENRHYFAARPRAGAAGVAVAAVADRGSGARFRRPVLSDQMATPATRIKTTNPAITAAIRIDRLPASAWLLMGGKGMIICCEHEGQFTCVPTLAVSQKIRWRHFGQTERNSLISIGESFGGQVLKFAG
jgi:hypothetical protein